MLAADAPGVEGRVFRALLLDALVLAVGGGVVHWFLLRPLLDLDGADLLADKLLHIVVPVLCLVGWLVFGPRGLIATRDVWGFLVVPVGWLLYTLVRGTFVDWYPYPFVDVGQHGSASCWSTRGHLGADARARLRGEVGRPPACPPEGGE